MDPQSGDPDMEILLEQCQFLDYAPEGEDGRVPYAIHNYTNVTPLESAAALVEAALRQWLGALATDQHVNGNINEGSESKLQSSSSTRMSGSSALSSGFTHTVHTTETRFGTHRGHAEKHQTTEDSLDEPIWCSRVIDLGDQGIWLLSLCATKRAAQLNTLLSASQCTQFASLGIGSIHEVDLLWQTAILDQQLLSHSNDELSHAFGLRCHVCLEPLQIRASSQQQSAQEQLQEARRIAISQESTNFALSVLNTACSRIRCYFPRLVRVSHEISSTLGESDLDDTQATQLLGPKSKNIPTSLWAGTLVLFAPNLLLAPTSNGSCTDKAAGCAPLVPILVPLVSAWFTRVSPALRYLGGLERFFKGSIVAAVRRREAGLTKGSTKRIFDLLQLFNPAASEDAEVQSAPLYQRSTPEAYFPRKPLVSTALNYVMRLSSEDSLPSSREECSTDWSFLNGLLGTYLKETELVANFYRYEVELQSNFIRSACGLSVAPPSNVLSGWSWRIVRRNPPQSQPQLYFVLDYTAQPTSNTKSADVSSSSVRTFLRLLDKIATFRSALLLGGYSESPKSNSRVKFGSWVQPFSPVRPPCTISGRVVCDPHTADQYNWHDGAQEHPLTRGVPWGSLADPLGGMLLRVTWPFAPCDSFVDTEVDTDFVPEASSDWYLAPRWSTSPNASSCILTDALLRISRLVLQSARLIHLEKVAGKADDINVLSDQALANAQSRVAKLAEDILSGTRGENSARDRGPDLSVVDFSHLVLGSHSKQPCQSSHIPQLLLDPLPVSAIYSIPLDSELLLAAHLVGQQQKLQRTEGEVDQACDVRDHASPSSSDENGSEPISSMPHNPFFDKDDADEAEEEELFGYASRRTLLEGIYQLRATPSPEQPHADVMVSQRSTSGKTLEFSAVRTVLMNSEIEQSLDNIFNCDSSCVPLYSYHSMVFLSPSTPITSSIKLSNALTLAPSLALSSLAMHPSPWPSPHLVMPETQRATGPSRSRASPRCMAPWGSLTGRFASELLALAARKPALISLPGLASLWRGWIGRLREACGIVGNKCRPFLPHTHPTAPALALGALPPYLNYRRQTALYDAATKLQQIGLSSVDLARALDQFDKAWYPPFGDPPCSDRDEVRLSLAGLHALGNNWCLLHQHVQALARCISVQRWWCDPGFRESTDPARWDSEVEGHRWARIYVRRATAERKSRPRDVSKKDSPSDDCGIDIVVVGEAPRGSIESFSGAAGLSRKVLECSSNIIPPPLQLPLCFARGVHLPIAPEECHDDTSVVEATLDEAKSTAARRPHLFTPDKRSGRDLRAGYGHESSEEDEDEDADEYLSPTEDDTKPGAASTALASLAKSAFPRVSRTPIKILGLEQPEGNVDVELDSGDDGEAEKLPIAQILNNELGSASSPTKSSDDNDEEFCDVEEIPIGGTADGAASAHVQGAPDCATQSDWKRIASDVRDFEGLSKMLLSKVPISLWIPSIFTPRLLSETLLFEDVEKLATFASTPVLTGARSAEVFSGEDLEPALVSAAPQSVGDIGCVYEFRRDILQRHLCLDDEPPENLAEKDLTSLGLSTSAFEILTVTDSEITFAHMHPDSTLATLLTSSYCKQVMCTADPHHPLRHPAVQPLRSLCATDARIAERFASSTRSGEERILSYNPQQREILRSDMLAFRAANPLSIYADFVHWYAPHHYDAGTFERSATCNEYALVLVALYHMLQDAQLKRTAPASRSNLDSSVSERKRSRSIIACLLRCARAHLKLSSRIRSLEGHSWASIWSERKSSEISPRLPRKCAYEQTPLFPDECERLLSEVEDTALHSLLLQLWGVTQEVALALLASTDSASVIHPADKASQRRHERSWIEQTVGLSVTKRALQLVANALQGHTVNPIPTTQLLDSFANAESLCARALSLLQIMPNHPDLVAKLLETVRIIDITQTAVDFASRVESKASEFDVQQEEVDIPIALNPSAVGYTNYYGQVAYLDQACGAVENPILPFVSLCQSDAVKEGYLDFEEELVLLRRAVHLCGLQNALDSVQARCSRTALKALKDTRRRLAEFECYLASRCAPLTGVGAFAISRAPPPPPRPVLLQTKSERHDATQLLDTRSGALVTGNAQTVFTTPPAKYGLEEGLEELTRNMHAKERSEAASRADSKAVLPLPALREYTLVQPLHGEPASMWPRLAVALPPESGARVSLSGLVLGQPLELEDLM